MISSSPSKNNSNLLLTYYGDDFTGSTDAMEVLQMHGVSTTLFLEPPDEKRRSQTPDCRAIGVAGISRSLRTEDMEEELRPKFEALRGFAAPLMHYKVCSTFDSSSHIGSIGKAMDIGFEVFKPTWSPIVIGAPRLNRFVVFGNLFARVGSVTYRLDRHPTMSRHPITPMTESDIRRHLAQQTEKSIGLVDILQMQAPEAIRDAALKVAKESHPLVLLDTLGQEQLVLIGQWIWEEAGKAVTFSASSSGLEYALVAFWQKAGLIEMPSSFTSPGRAEKLVIMSGSVSPTTAAQIRHARERGCDMMKLPCADLLNRATREATINTVVEKARGVLREKDVLLLHSAEGPEDPAIPETREAARQCAIPSLGTALGQIQGTLLRRILDETGIRRVCVAGGDTSGYCAKALGIFALRMIIPIAPGAPLCRAYADGPLDGLAISLKGGQCGKPDYFQCIQNGNARGGG